MRFGRAVSGIRDPLMRFIGDGLRREVLWDILALRGRCGRLCAIIISAMLCDWILDQLRTPRDNASIRH